MVSTAGLAWVEAERARIEAETMKRPSSCVEAGCAGRFPAAREGIPDAAIDLCGPSL